MRLFSITSHITLCPLIFVTAKFLVSQVYARLSLLSLRLAPTSIPELILMYRAKGLSFSAPPTLLAPFPAPRHASQLMYPTTPASSWTTQALATGRWPRCTPSPPSLWQPVTLSAFQAESMQVRQMNIAVDAILDHLIIRQTGGHKFPGPFPGPDPTIDLQEPEVLGRIS